MISPKTILIMSVSLALVSQVHASDQTVTKAAVSITTSQSININNPEQESGVASLVSGVSESADRLQKAVEQFGVAMGNAKTQDAGMKALDEMLEAARNVNNSLNKDSKIWNELQELITDWTKKRDSVIERSRNNPGLQPLAARWQEKVERVVELRKSILDQASDSNLLIQDIENKREVIAEYYELDAIDQVIAEMQVMNEELTAMNKSMREILEQTVGVEEGRVPATN